MGRNLRWVLIALIIGIVGVGPVLFYRAVYGHNKRLREIVPGLVYRSGQLTVEGFTDAQTRLGIKTIINLQDDFPDPDLATSFLDRRKMKESDLCRQLGIRYVFIGPDLIWRKQVGKERPEAIEQFLAVMDDPDSYPVLIHCKAGLHRTGCMAAIYRMEYQGWTPRQAVQEIKLHGFGEWACTADNDYIMQYVLSYKPGVRHTVRSQGSGVRGQESVRLVP